MEGANGRKGVPVVNFLGWMTLVFSTVYIYERLSEDDGSSGGSRIPTLLLAPYYLVAVAWAIKNRKFQYSLYSVAFPAALYAAFEKR